MIGQTVGGRVLQSMNVVVRAELYSMQLAGDKVDEFLGLLLQPIMRWFL